MNRAAAAALAAVTVGADVVLYAAAEGGSYTWHVMVFAVLALLVVTFAGRWPTGVFLGAGVFACASGAAFCLLLLTSYRAGSARLGTWRLVTAAGAVTALVFTRAALSAHQPVSLTPVVALVAVFVLVPVLAGRLQARHRDLVSALASRNLHLEAERLLVAQQERLRQRLQLARDVHDVLGRHLCMATLAAAGMRASATNDQQRELAEQVLDNTRAAAEQTHLLVGALRNPGDRQAAIPAKAEELDDLCAQFRRAGMSVNVSIHGRPARGLGPVVSHAAYRILQEGLTNAATHAPGQPVTVQVTWESDALLLRVVNSTSTRGVVGATGARPRTAGHGLDGLAEQVELVGGLIEHTDGSAKSSTFALSAMLPLEERGSAPANELHMVGGLGPVKVMAMSLLFVVVPASMLLGAR